jgi:hypothetical protein
MYTSDGVFFLLTTAAATTLMQIACTYLDDGMSDATEEVIKGIGIVVAW